MTNPRITRLTEKKLVGLSHTMSLAQNATAELWRAFMPRKNQIENAIGTDLYSLQEYESDYFRNFSSLREFRKWALLEVSSFDAVPQGMDAFILPGGDYAVFVHRGLSTNKSIFQYIYTQWLPASSFALDDRPHFELLGSKYKNNDPESEEEIWIPIRQKS